MRTGTVLFVLSVAAICFVQLASAQKGARRPGRRPPWWPPRPSKPKPDGQTRPADAPTKPPLPEGATRPSRRPPWWSGPKPTTEEGATKPAGEPCRGWWCKPDRPRPTRPEGQTRPTNTEDNPKPPRRPGWWRPRG